MKTAPFIAALLFASLAVAEDDGKLTIEIPSSVQASIAKEKGDAGKVREFKRVNEADGTTYLIGLVIDGQNYMMALDAAGRVMKKEMETDDDEPKPMKVAELPVKVRQTMQREAGAGVIESIDRFDAKTTYVTEVNIGTRRYRIVVDADGLLVAKEHVGEAEEK
jgi:hypothetical protein